MTKTTLADVVQQLAKLATDHGKTSKDFDELKEFTHQSLSSINTVLQNLPTKEEILSIRDEIRNIVVSDEYQHVITETVKEKIESELEPQKKRINFLENKVLSMEFRELHKQVTISNIKRKGQKNARLAILASLTKDFQDIPFEASYMGTPDNYRLIHITFPSITTKYSFNSLLAANKVGSLLGIYTSEYIPKFLEKEKDKLATIAKDLKKKKMITTWSLILQNNRLALRVASKDNKGNRIWHKTKGGQNKDTPVFDPPLSATGNGKTPMSNSPSMTETEDGMTTPPPLHNSKKRSVPSPEKAQTAPAKKKN